MRSMKNEQEGIIDQDKGAIIISRWIFKSLKANLIDLFLDWLQNVERIFEFKDILEGKKVKLVPLKLRKYAFIWLSNVVSKRVRKGKEKIKTWDKIKAKLKSKFLPPYYLQDNVFELHHLKQGCKSVEEYTRGFE